MMTIAEKILARASGRSKVSPGEHIMAKVDLAMAPGGLQRLPSAVANAGIREDLIKVWDPERFVGVLDHGIPTHDVPGAEYVKRDREVAKKIKAKYFYDVYAGIGHQVIHEKGHVRPGQLIVGKDSHTTTYGALNVASTGVSAVDIFYTILTGELWFMVPETIKFEISGHLPKGVYSKDVILYVAGKYGTDVAQYKSIEWVGSAVDSMSLDARLTMANMSIELGAKFGIFKADQKTLDYIKARTDKEFETVDADPDATYASKYVINASELDPQVAFPYSVGNVRNISEAKGIKINQAQIGSCAHGRLEDIETAAEIIKGKKVHPEVRFYIGPASWEIYKVLLDSGTLRTLLDAGVMVSEPYCGFCSQLGSLAAGERSIAATPRNFRGRHGSPDAEVYLASAATVAASALKGEITDPREVM